MLKKLPYIFLTVFGGLMWVLFFGIMLASGRVYYYEPNPIILTVEFFTALILMLYGIYLLGGKDE